MDRGGVEILDFSACSNFDLIIVLRRVHHRAATLGCHTINCPPLSFSPFLCFLLLYFCSCTCGTGSIDVSMQILLAAQNSKEIPKR